MQHPPPVVQQQPAVIQQPPPVVQQQLPAATASPQQTNNTKKSFTIPKRRVVEETSANPGYSTGANKKKKNLTVGDMSKIWEDQSLGPMSKPLVEGENPNVGNVQFTEPSFDTYNAAPFDNNTFKSMEELTAYQVTCLFNNNIPVISQMMLCQVSTEDFVRKLLPNKATDTCQYAFYNFKNEKDYVANVPEMLRDNYELGKQRAQEHHKRFVQAMLHSTTGLWILNTLAKINFSINYAADTEKEQIQPLWTTLFSKLIAERKVIMVSEKTSLREIMAKHGLNSKEQQDFIKALLFVEHSYNLDNLFHHFEEHISALPTKDPASKPVDGTTTSAMPFTDYLYVSVTTPNLICLYSNLTLFSGITRKSYDHRRQQCFELVETLLKCAYNCSQRRADHKQSSFVFDFTSDVLYNNLVRKFDGGISIALLLNLVKCTSNTTWHELDTKGFQAFPTATKEMKTMKNLEVYKSLQVDGLFPSSLIERRDLPMIAILVPSRHALAASLTNLSQVSKNLDLLTVVNGLRKKVSTLEKTTEQMKQKLNILTKCVIVDVESEDSGSDRSTRSGQTPAPALAQAVPPTPATQSFQAPTPVWIQNPTAGTLSIPTTVQALAPTPAPAPTPALPPNPVEPVPGPSDEPTQYTVQLLQSTVTYSPTNPNMGIIQVYKPDNSHQEEEPCPPGSDLLDYDEDEEAVKNLTYE